ncbi:MAG: type II secretion system protein GspG, partial [Verrucomicrobiales bacterium]|nr:type II secretion system protein GspG [Verrucomicrobiales bacterium]
MNESGNIGASHGSHSLLDRTEIGRTAVVLLAGFTFTAIAFWPSRYFCVVPYEASVRPQLSTLYTAVHAFKALGGSYPTTEQGLSALATKPTLPPLPLTWKSLVKMDSLIDPWGTPYVYRLVDPEKGIIAIHSNGPDLKEGTEDDLSLEL